MELLSKIPHLGPLLQTWRGRLIALVVISQLLIPIAYYTTRRDPHDERFAWRMFSPMRMAQCKPDMAVDGKKIELGTEFHEAWIEIAKRGRFVVLEAMAAKLCRKQPGVKVTLKLACKYLSRAQTDVPQQCTADTDCDRGLHCARNTCVECTSDDQCPIGNECEANACIAKFGGFDLCEIPEI